MLLKLLISSLAVLCALGFTESGVASLDLEESSPEEVRQLIQEENYVLVLFMKSAECVDDCRTKEESLLNIREEIAEALGAWVIRSNAPTLLQELGGDPSTDSIVFVRNEKPLFYSGSLEDEDEVLRYFIAYKDSNVRNLSDDTFEHETQASSGATTGDWLVFFIKDDCEKCDQLIGHIETTAAALKNRKNVALMHRESESAVTTRRFGVTSFPHVILFRLGNLYRYSLPSMTHSSLTAFAEDGFRNTQREEIPLPKTPFDDVTQAIADWLRENPWQFLGSVCGFILVIGILYALNSPPPSSWAKKSKKKKNN